MQRGHRWDGQQPRPLGFFKRLCAGRRGMLRLLCGATGPLLPARCAFQGAEQHPATPKREGAGLHASCLPTATLPGWGEQETVPPHGHCSTLWPPWPSWRWISRPSPPPGGSNPCGLLTARLCPPALLPWKSVLLLATLTLSFARPILHPAPLSTGTGTGFTMSRQQPGGWVQPRSEEPAGIQKGCFM